MIKAFILVFVVLTIILTMLAMLVFLHPSHLNRKLFVHLLKWWACFVVGVASAGFILHLLMQLNHL
jgi:hypothetical protein